MRVSILRRCSCRRSLPETRFISESTTNCRKLATNRSLIGGVPSRGGDQAGVVLLPSGDSPTTTDLSTLVTVASATTSAKPPQLNTMAVFTAPPSEAMDSVPSSASAVSAAVSSARSSRL